MNGSARGIIFQAIDHSMLSCVRGPKAAIKKRRRQKHTRTKKEEQEEEEEEEEEAGGKETHTTLDSASWN